MKAKRSAKDIISTLPHNIIETILCHLDIRDAVRTSVLSKNWRYSWTRIPKLVFVEHTFQNLPGRDQLSVMEEEIEMQSPRNIPSTLNKCKFLYAIYQVLLTHQGPILQFTLDLTIEGSCFEIDQIILHLSRSNTVTELKLLLSGDSYELPLSIYSLHNLTDLHLSNCCIEHQPTLSGFGSLTTLCLEDVMISTKTLLHLLSKSPLLKSVTLTINYGLINIVDLTEDAVPTSFVHLKYVSLDMCFIGNNWLWFLALIKSSPNIEKINLQFCVEQDIETNPVTLKDYSNIWLEHLYELNIGNFGNLKTELEFVKLILAKSPVLKEARIGLYYCVTKDEEIQLLRTLLRCPSVSPVAEIIVKQ